MGGGAGASPCSGTAVVVVGGGITGLAAARRLRAGGADVMLLEGSERVGGKIVTHRLGEALVEGGPDWFVTRVPDARALACDLGLEGDLVPPAASGALVVRGGRPRKLPAGFVRGVPPSARAALASGFVSPRGALRMVADYVLPGPLRGPDVSLGHLVRRRLGRQVLERLVDPMLAASRSGGPDEVSLAAAAPELDQAARTSRSLMRALRARPPETAPPAFAGIRGGTVRLVDALADDLRRAGVAIRTGAPAERVEPAGAGWRVIGGGDAAEAAAVLVAVPAPSAARLLATSAPGAGRLLRRLVFEPAAVVGLAYRAGSAPAPAGASGVLVPRRERRTVTACAWFSAKWPHASPPGGPDVLRAFVTAPPDDDEALVAAAARDVNLLTGAPSSFDAAVVSRWDDALPVLGVGHLDLVGEIRRALPPGITLAGAGYDGSGLPDCIRGGEAAAAALLAPRG